MQQLANKKILFVFSDSGGAKPILALIEQLQLPDYIVISDREYSFYEDFKVSVQKFSGDPFRELAEFQPNLVFTGTSHPADIERRFIAASKIRKIETISFIDHWTNMVLRFTDSDGKVNLPDKIWVIDERAENLAHRAGIGKEKTVISGNPYHSWLRIWKPSVNKSEFYKSLNTDASKKIILFGPDPLSNINGKEKFGFDEISVTQELIQMFKVEKEVLSDYLLLVKPHPNQNLRLLSDIIPNCKSVRLLSKSVDTNTALFYSNITMGFFSSLLLEASILGKKVFRYIPVKLEKDPLEWGKLDLKVSKKNFITVINQF